MNLGSIAGLGMCAALLGACTYSVRNDPLQPQNSRVDVDVVYAPGHATVRIRNITCRAGLGTPTSSGPGPEAEVNYNENFSVDLSTPIGGIDTHFWVSGMISRLPTGEMKTSISVTSKQLRDALDAPPL